MVIVKQKNPGWLGRLVKSYQTDERLALGWPMSTPSTGLRYPDGTLVMMVAAVQQLGASISHPGGTGFTVTAKGAKFRHKGFVGPVHGVTGAHVIEIPARDFMNPGNVKAVQDTRPIVKALLPALNQGKITKAEILEKMGPTSVAAMQYAIHALVDPPNAPSTIRRKKSASPLEDTGLMRQSVTYIVRSPSK